MRIINFIKKEKWFILANLLIIAIFLVKLPYYISAPGGIRDLSTRIKMEDGSLNRNAFHITFLKEYEGRLPLLAFSLINKDYKISKVENEYIDYETDMKIGRLMFEDSFDNATESAFKLAGLEYSIINNKIIVTYYQEHLKNKIEYGDQLLKVNDDFLNNADEFKKLINSKKIGEIVEVEILRNDSIIKEKLKIKEIDGKAKIGLGVINNRDFLLSEEIKINLNSKEVGPSGGLMASLFIYYEVINKKIDYKIAGTGTIEVDGVVGEIGGIDLKVISAAKSKVDIFFVPKTQYEEALKSKNKKNLKLNIVPVSSLEEAVAYINSYKK